WQVLDVLQSLLEVPAFVALVQELLHHENARLRRKALHMLNTRMEKAAAAGGFTPEESSLFLDMLPILREVIAGSRGGLSAAAGTCKVADSRTGGGGASGGGGDDEQNGAGENAINLQTALLSVDVLARMLGVQHPEAFAGVLDDITALVAAGLPLPGQGGGSGAGGGKSGGISGDSHPAYLANSAYLSLATLTAKLGPRAFPKLPVFFPAVLSALEWCGSGAAAPGEAGTAKAVRLLQASALSAVATVAASLPQFLSPFLRRTLAAALAPAVHNGGGGDASVTANADCVLRLLARGVQMRVLLPAVVDTFPVCAARGPASVGALLAFAADAVGALTRADAAIHLQALAEFYMLALDYRRSVAAAAAAPVQLVPAAGGDTMVVEEETAGIARAAGALRAAVAAAAADAAGVAAVEERATAALMALVLRLNEDELRPLFLQLCEWKSALIIDPLAGGVGAIGGGSGGGGAALATDTASVDRFIAFFAAVERLAATLKSIFVPYFRYVLEDCRAALDVAAGTASATASVASDSAALEPRKKKRKTSGGGKDAGSGTAGEAAVAAVVRPLDGERATLLLRRVTAALQHCFRFDSNGFMDVDCFELIMPALVRLLDSPALLVAGADDYATLTAETVAPCLGQLAVAAGCEALWKPLLHTLLLKTRAGEARVRAAAVTAVGECFSAVGEDLLGLLPECLPFFSELLEDDDAT
ncbi:unnamed protein product, partial [Phaeothamnion confervicola]